MSQMRRAPNAFDQLIRTHGNLWLQTWLKLEHRPQFFHWIARARMAPGQWNVASLTRHFQDTERAFGRDRQTWIDWIERYQPDLGENQVAFLRKRSKNLNLAIRLVSPFHEKDPLWDLSYAEQVRSIEASICRMKPLIEFFVGNA